MEIRSRFCPDSFNGFRHCVRFPRALSASARGRSTFIRRKRTRRIQLFWKAEKRRDRADSVSQFLRHRQLDPDRRDGGALTQTVHH